MAKGQGEEPVRQCFLSRMVTVVDCAYTAGMLLNCRLERLALPSDGRQKSPKPNYVAFYVGHLR